MADRPLFQSPKGLIQAELRKRGESAEMPLRSYIQAAWKIVDAKPYLSNWHIDCLAEHLEAVSKNQINRLIFNVPPGYGKSLIVSVFYPTWQWGPHGHPETRFLCTSYGGDDGTPALRDSTKARQVMESTWYQGEWGTNFAFSKDQNTKQFYTNNKHGYRVSVGMQGAVSGQRADVLLIDDPTKLEEAQNLASVKEASQIWELSLRSRITDDNAAVVLIMQRLHEADLTGYFLKQDGWTHVRLPALFEKEHKCTVYLNGAVFWEDPRTREGQPIHPERVDATQEARTLQRVSPWVFASQQQQRPVPLEGAIIKTHWIQRWSILPPVFEECIIVVDCAFKKQEDNSWVVMQCWGRRDAHAYLVGQLRMHLDLPETILELVNFSRQYPVATGKYVESKANGVGVVQMLKNRLPGLIGTDDDENVLKPFCSGSKEAKLQAVAPYFQAGNVLIPANEARERFSGTGDALDYINEVTTFPKSSFDDQVDGTSMGVWKLLHMFEAHVSVSEMMRQEDANRSPLAGMFDKVYGDANGATYDVTGLGSLARDAYGRGN